MRQIIVAAAMALGLIALWAAILPLTAQPAPKHAAASPAMSKALFLCRGSDGINQACVAALARATVIDTTATDAAGDAPTPVSDRRCLADPQMLASLARPG